MKTDLDRGQQRPSLDVVLDSTSKVNRSCCEPFLILAFISDSTEYFSDQVYSPGSYGVSALTTRFWLLPILQRSRLRFEFHLCVTLLPQSRVTPSRSRRWRVRDYQLRWIGAVILVGRLLHVATSRRKECVWISKWKIELKWAAGAILYYFHLWIMALIHWRLKAMEMIDNPSKSDGCQSFLISSGFPLDWKVPIFCGNFNPTSCCQTGSV